MSKTGRSNQQDRQHTAMDKSEAVQKTPASMPQNHHLMGVFWHMRNMLRTDKLAYAVILLIFGLGVTTFAYLTGVEDVQAQNDVLETIFAVGLIALVVMLFIVGRQLVSLWQERRAQMAGSQLHFRLALLFGGITVVPSILVAFFAISVVDYSLRGWFAERISTAVEKSVTVADAYLEEHTRSVRGQILAMANDVNRDAPRFINNRQQLNDFISQQVGIRNLSEAVILDGTGQILAKSRFSFAITFENLEKEWLDRARAGEVVVIRSDENNKLQAVVKLTSFIDAYLMVGRFVDSSVLSAVDETRLAASDYQSLSFSQVDIQITMAVLFMVVAVLMLLAALFVGLSLANSIVGPLGGVIKVADEVRTGNLAPRVDVIGELDEIDRLGASFNSMLDELSTSQKQLVAANKQLDQRREFTEAVLGGVSSGVIGLDREGRITLPNQTACQMLGKKVSDMHFRPLIDVQPEFAPLLDRAQSGRSVNKEQQITLQAGGERRILRARLTVERVEGGIIGYVVTFDDVTDLLSAQRKAAWSDIARRIAHEIKNPLTPIELAADRLLKKFRPEDKDAAGRFDEYVSIISRQVGDIGRMVDEFSAFARMPNAQLEKIDLAAELRGQIDMARIQSGDVVITSAIPDAPVETAMDAGLIRQALTNLLQNALDSLIENGIETPEIHVELTRANNDILVKISDNGIGFADLNDHDYFEPYVTTREKGTGLGLSIVQKIVQEHGGMITLANQDTGGALITLRFSDNG